MRYQYPAPNPFGHYWDEESVRVWGIGFGISKKAGYYLSYLLGEILLANLFLLFQFILNQSIALGSRRAIARISSRVDLSAILKRSIDIVGASLGLILTLPLWLLVAVVIKLDSRGPVFFKQERVGQNRRRGDRRTVSMAGPEKRTSADRRVQPGHGKSFWIYKFRSMQVNAESACGPVWAQKNDSRITRVGRIMRATRIDELPQMINVLAGDMSLVGPRPERPFFVNELRTKIKDYTSRFDVKPGITGLAQVEHKYDESIEDVSKKVTYDLNYIRNWTVLQDIKIIAKTVTVVLSARGM
jgi:lipopolysaccharide/colanic/teichoic acid biosynthesis glycosyltransferase